MFERKFFILSPSFHGATLLARLLNAHPEILALGDTYPSNRFDQVCGCGSKVSECDFWQAVKKRVGADRYREEPTLLPLFPRILGGRIDDLLYAFAPMGVVGRVIGGKELQEFRDDYRGFLHALYDLASPNPASVFVDGVKSIARVKALLLAGEGVDGVIHLVRNTGDFVKSYMRQKGAGPGTLARASLIWRLYHGGAANLARNVPYMRVNYEALADETEETMAHLFRFLGVPPIGMKAMTADLEEPWHFMGNASLLTFDGRIRRSRHRLGRIERHLVRAITGFGEGV